MESLSPCAIEIVRITHFHSHITNVPVPFISDSALNMPTRLLSIFNFPVAFSSNIATPLLLDTPSLGA